MNTIREIYGDYGAKYIADATLTCGNSCAVVRSTSIPVGASFRFYKRKPKDIYKDKKFGSYKIGHEVVKLGDIYLQIKLAISNADAGRNKRPGWPTKCKSRAKCEHPSVISTYLTGLNGLYYMLRQGKHDWYKHTVTHYPKETIDKVKAEVKEAFKGKYIIMLCNYQLYGLKEVQAYFDVLKNPIYTSPVFNNLAHPEINNYLVVHIYDYTKE